MGKIKGHSNPQKRKQENKINAPLLNTCFSTVKSEPRYMYVQTVTSTSINNQSERKLQAN